MVLVNDACEVPWEFTAEPGIKYVSVFAGDLITANKAKVEVFESGYKEGETPEPPTPTVYEQFVSLVEEIGDKASKSAGQAEQSAVSASDSSARAVAAAEVAARSSEQASKSAQSASESETNAKSSEMAAQKAASEIVADREQIKTNKRNINELNGDLSDLAPAGAAVGQLFRVAAVSEDGKYTMEPVDMLDVQINGASIVQDRVAILPVASVRNYGGIVRLKYAQGFTSDVDGFLQAYNENSYISNRYVGIPLELSHLDFAVKAAMCDGKGAAWTAEEQAAARERMGIHKVTQTEYDALNDTRGIYIIVEE